MYAIQHFHHVSMDSQEILTATVIVPLKFVEQINIGATLNADVSAIQELVYMEEFSMRTHADAKEVTSINFDRKKYF